MALWEAGFVAGTRMDTAEAADVSYPGFFQLVAGYGGEGEGERGVRED
jgi:5-enolpyruvylshikimate-3-phosphate synthase